MPYKEKETMKLFYSIGEVADMFDVNASLIRFWEKEFSSLLQFSKDTRGNRQFTEQDISKLRILHDLIKVQGFTLDGAKKHLKEKENRKEATDKESLHKSLEKIKGELLALKKKLAS
jgi:DNA-binding transcriptional MerR regulator